MTRCLTLTALLAVVAFGCDAAEPELQPFDPALLVGVTWAVSDQPDPLPFVSPRGLTAGAALQFDADDTGTLYESDDAPLRFRWSTGADGTSLRMAFVGGETVPPPVEVGQVEVGGGRLSFVGSTEMRDASGAVRQVPATARLVPGETPEALFLRDAAAEPRGFSRTAGGTAHGVTSWDYDDWRTNPAAGQAFSVDAPVGPNPFPLRPPATARFAYVYAWLLDAWPDRERQRIEGIRVLGRTRAGEEVVLVDASIAEGRRHLIFEFEPSALTRGGEDGGLYRLSFVDYSGRLLTYGDLMIE